MEEMSNVFERMSDTWNGQDMQSKCRQKLSHTESKVHSVSAWKSSREREMEHTMKQERKQRGKQTIKGGMDSFDSG